MKIKFFLMLLLFCGVAQAKEAKTCQLVDDTAEMLMQLRQSGLSLDDIEINPEALKPQEAQLLKQMIADAKMTPVYQISLTRQKAIDDFNQKWQQYCQQHLQSELK